LTESFGLTFDNRGNIAAEESDYKTNVSVYLLLETKEEDNLLLFGQFQKEDKQHTM
jgi:hypothetical protein